MSISNATKLDNFLRAQEDYDETGRDNTTGACTTGVNDLSMSYDKKVAIVRDILRSRFHETKKTTTDDGDIDSFVPTLYNQPYAYFRTYHQLGDIDSKNISLYSIAGASTWRTKLLEGVLDQHMNAIGYASFIDYLSRETAGYGNGIIKIVDGVPYVANLLNVVFDNRLGDIQKSSIVEYFALPYHKAVERFPDYKDKIDEIYNIISQDGYNEIQFIEFWSWFEFANKIKKGCATFLIAEPKRYTQSERLAHYKEKVLNDGFVWEDKIEVSIKESLYWKRDIEGEKIEQLFPYEISEAFPVDGEIRAQGIIEIILPLAKRFNQLMERLDRLMNSSMSGVKKLEIAQGFESDISAEDILHGRPDEVIPIVKDKQDIVPIVDQSVVTEGQAILNMIQFIKNMMNEISGVTSFAMSAEINQSAKATTSAALVSSSQTPFKKFIERMGEAHKKILGDFILPYILEHKMNKDVVLSSISHNTRQEIVREAAVNEVNRNWDKFNKKIWNETKKLAKNNPNVVVRGATKQDYEAEIERLIQKFASQPIKFKLKDWAKKIGAEVVIDIDNEYADKERKFNKLIQMGTVPMVQAVTKAEEYVTELLRNSDIDNYDWVKTKSERQEEQREEAEMEVFKNIGAQRVAAEQGDFGNLGGAPTTETGLPDNLTARQSNRIEGQGVTLAQPII